MKDASKTKAQLIEDLAALRRRVAELEALQESEQRARQITSSLREAVWLRDTRTLEVLYVNHAYETIWGRTCESLYANPTSFLDAVYREDRERVLAAVRNQYRGIFFNEEYRIVRPDGSLRWVWGRTFPIENDAGEVYRIVAVVEDITQHKQVEAQRDATLEALEASKEQFRNLVETVKDWIWEVDPQGVYTYVSPRVRDILGYEPEELLGKTPFDLMPAEEARRLVATFQAIVMAREPLEAVENTCLHKDGHAVILETSGVPFFAPDGTLKGYRGVDRDITERKQAEQETRRQAEMLAALHETALDLAAQRSLPDLLRAIVVRAVSLLKAKEGGLLFYRPATDDLERVLAYNFDLGPEDKVVRRGEGLVGKVLDSGRPLVVDDYNRWEGRRKQHEESFAIVGMPIFWGDRLLGVLDITDGFPRTFLAADIALLERFTPLAAAALENNRLLRDLQEQMDKLKQTQAQLVQAAKLAAMGELAAGVAHELNNPLTSVLGFAAWLVDHQAADSPSRHDLEIIAREAVRARDIVRNLLDFARQTKPLRQPADVNEVLRQTLDLIRQHLEKSGVAIEEDYAPGVGLVTLDSAQMKQVFLNLITNAAQAMPRGGKLSLRTACVGDEVAVAISDTGVGIPPEIQERIFDPFFTTKPVGQGTGLGLPVSLGIVQEHGGRISVESRVGQPAPGSGPAGSTFTVWLPLETQRIVEESTPGTNCP